MVGVWPAGKALSVITETAGVRSVTVRGVVLDYGFAPGAEAEFEALRSTAAGRLYPRPVTTPLHHFAVPLPCGGGIGPASPQTKRLDFQTLTAKLVHPEQGRNES